MYDWKCELQIEEDAHSKDIAGQAVYLHFLSIHEFQPQTGSFSVPRIISILRTRIYDTPHRPSVNGIINSRTPELEQERAPEAAKECMMRYKRDEQMRKV